ncbi:MAG: tRNA lysidine(34) synthetase TilS [Clostridiales bacterium]|nr:tRNA lysidine(34) synthetase TilS [Clostridiales bacterium]
MLKEKVLNTINKYNMITKEDKNILIAVSGGFDSTCLLYLLNELKTELNINLYVAHINHGLRENAILDEEFVKKTCCKLDIPFFVDKPNINEIAKIEKMSIEMAGRKARYEFFDKIAKENNCTKIALAHNANDNVETILLNLFRGSGLNGLKGIKKVRDNKYIRPLIEITRKEIDEWLKENNITARLDESNNESEYTRNKVRNELLPYIQKNFNENVIANINRMSDNITEDDEYINNVVEDLFNQNVINCENDSIVINGKKIINYEINIQKRLILKCIEKLNGTTMQIEQVHINDILKMINKNVGNKFICPNKYLKVYLNRGKVYFTKQNI